MDNAWYSKIEGQVFSQIEYMLKYRAEAPFPTLNCTSVNENIVPTQLPTLFCHELQPVEVGQDLDNISVNAVMSTIEIQVWTDKGQTECKSILVEAITEMKRLRYNIIMFPTVTTNNGISWGALRARRVIGAGDKL